MVFAEILNCNRLSLYLNKDRVLNKKESFLASWALKRRIAGEPIPHILGKTEFMGLEFKVTPDVFIPRPETEILVEKTIEIVKLLNCQTVKLLEIGTGSGCIAISLAKIMPNVKITATDISPKALEIARYNAGLNNASINFIQGDLFDTYNPLPNTYNLIVSNPPYIPAGDIDDLPNEVRYEPRIAIDGGRDGLDFYRRIIDGSPAYLKQGGFLIMEMGFNQKNAIENIFQNAGNFEIISAVKDYSNIERVIVARKLRK